MVGIIKPRESRYPGSYCLVDLDHTCRLPTPGERMHKCASQRIMYGPWET